MARISSTDTCFQSDLFRECSQLTVGVKPYIPGITISRDHSFVKKLDEWKLRYGNVSRSETTSVMIRAHPGNPLAVIEGNDNIDYVLHDKSEGGKHFADSQARELADIFLWDLGEGLAEVGTGLPDKYWQNVIMVPTNGHQSEYRYDKGSYEHEYIKQRSAKLAREQLPNNVRGKTTAEVIREIMMSPMVIGTLRQKLGYYELSTNDRFQNVSDKFLKELMAVDGNHLSGTDDISLSPLFIQQLNAPEITSKDKETKTLASTSFNYGFGKLFKRSNIRTTRGCRPSKFNRGLNVKFLRRVGLACSGSYIGLGGTFVVDEEEIQERDRVLQDNQAFFREKKQRSGEEVFDQRQTFPVGTLVLARRGRNDIKKDKATPAHFLLLTKTRLDHRSVLPLVLMAEMMKSELVTYLMLLKIIDAQTRSPSSNRYEKDALELGERTVITYQRFVETLHPCRSWWGDGTIVSGERWKATTMSLFSFSATKLAPTWNAMLKALKIEDEDHRATKVLEQIERECDTSGKHYLFLPVVESKSLMFTNEDSVFVSNNKDCILKEREVSKLFELREARKGRFPKTVVSAVVSLGAFEKSAMSEMNTRTSTIKMTLDLEQPNSKLLKAETIRVFRISDYSDEEEEPDYSAKIQGYLEAIKIKAFRKDNVALTTENIEVYMEGMELSQGEREDVIHQLVKEMDSDQEGPPDNEADDTVRWRDRDDSGTPDDDGPQVKRYKYDDYGHN